MQHRCYLFEGQITNDKIFHDTSLKVRSQMTRYSNSDYLYFSRVLMRPRIFIITVFVPLQCNIDVTSLKVKSQMTTYSMIQTIYTFPGFKTRPHFYHYSVCTITVQHRCLYHYSFPGFNARLCINGRPHIYARPHISSFLFPADSQCKKFKQLPL